MFEALSERFTKIFSKLSRKNNLTEENIAETLQDIRRALLASDVSFEIVQTLIEEIRNECVGQAVFKNVKPGQQVVKIVYDKLVDILGGNLAALNEKRPLHILLVGLQGAGKTTTAAKLATFLKAAGEKPCLVACDIQRPAAIEQLKILGQQIEVPVFHKEKSSVLEIGRYALNSAPKEGCTVVIFDTAGRLQIDKLLLEEVKELQTLVQAEETLLVVDSALGQESVHVSKTFHELLHLTGIILTKLDGDAKGGAALSMKRAIDVPIKFAAIGEKVGDFEKFYPDRMASRILGMGDIVSLVEKSQAEMDEDTINNLTQRILSKDFNLEDFLTQLRQMKKMGSLSALSKWLPGVSGMQLGDKEENDLKHTEALILSMTPKERRQPNLLNSTYRRLRITKGAGLSISDFNRFLKRYQMMKKTYQKFRKADPKKLQNMLDSYSTASFLREK